MAGIQLVIYKLSKIVTLKCTFPQYSQDYQQFYQQQSGGLESEASSTSGNKLRLCFASLEVAVVEEVLTRPEATSQFLARNERVH